MLYVGIDPGLKGAIACYSSSRRRLDFVEDMPLAAHTRGKTKPDAEQLANFFRGRAKEIVLAVVEKVGPSPQMGVTSSFNFGLGAGVIEGVLSSLGVRWAYATPQLWKGWMRLDSNKNNSIELARKLFYKDSEYFTRKKDDGRAEAALLAKFACDAATKLVRNDETV